MRKSTLIVLTLTLAASFVFLGAGCKKNDSPAAPESATSTEPELEVITSPTKFPSTTVEYFMQSYRDKPLTTLDKRKLKLALVATGIDQGDNNKPMTLNFYTDPKWKEGKEHIFYIEEVKDKKSTYFGQFASQITKLAQESRGLKGGIIIGDFMKLESMSVK